MNLSPTDTDPVSSEALFQHSPLPMWVHSSTTGRFLAVNAAAVTEYGYSAVEFRELTLAAICPGVDARKEPASPPATEVFTTRLRRKDGEFRRVEIHANPLQYRGQSARVVLVVDLKARGKMVADPRARETLRREQLEAIASDEPLERILNKLLAGLTRDWPGTQMGLFHAEEGAGCAAISALAPEGATWGGPVSAALDPLSRDAWKETSGDTLLGPADFARWPAALAQVAQELGVTWATVQYFSTKPATAFWLLVWGTGTTPVAAELTARVQSKLQLLRLAITRQQTLSDLQQLAASLERRVAQQTEEVHRQADAMNATVEGLALLEGGIYVYMNPAHAAMYGYAVDELIGKPWTVLYDPVETRRLQEEAFPILAAQRHWSGETQGLRKDGSRITGDISLTITSKGYLVCACRDNTLRHQQTEAIRQSEEQLSLVLNSTTDGFWDWSITHGTVTYSAHYLEMLGHRSGELPNTSKTWSDRLHPDERTQVLAESTALRNGTAATFNREYRLRTKSGQWLWVHDRGKVVAYDKEGRPARAVGSLSDITQRSEAETALRQRTGELIELNAELARAAQGRDEFLARVSHELRTPLTSILALTEMLADMPMLAVDERALRQIRSIHDSGLHLLQLINEILDVAKLEAGQFQLKIAPCDAAEISRASLRLVSPQATRRELELTFEPGSAELHVLADPLRLKQMLVNLLGNSIKFTPAHGKVQLEISQPEPGRVQFRVSDTGIGISPDKLGQLFRPFMQLESGLNQSTGGSGLGLVIVKHFTELQQGSISVTSAPGSGSCFYLQLPEATPLPVPALPRPEATASTAPVDPATTEPPDRDHPSDPLTVLLVDDNELNRESLAEFLMRAGFKVIPVPDGASALRELLQVHPDVIIMDVQMPGMDGLEATRRLRQLPDAGIAGTPVLGLTAMAMPGDRERCLRAGMTEYQVKPFPLKLLPEVLKRLARSRPPQP